MRIAQASISTLRILYAIRHFEHHNLFLRRHNFLQPELAALVAFDRGQRPHFTVRHCPDANQVTSVLDHLGGRIRAIPK